MAGFLGGLYDLFGEGGVADETGTAAAADDFGYGATHIDVDAIELHFLGYFSDDLGVIFRRIAPNLGDDFDILFFEKLAFFVGYAEAVNDPVAGFSMNESVGRYKFGHDDMEGGWVGDG